MYRRYPEKIQNLEQEVLVIWKAPITFVCKGIHVASIPTHVSFLCKAMLYRRYPEK